LIRIVVGTVVISLIALYKLFPGTYIAGRSMYPTLKPNQILVATRIFNRKKLENGSVYIYKHDGKVIIKRLKATEDGGKYCYFLGDNPSESYDSRHYGFIKAENIIAKALWYKRNN
jgi:signal peptidase I